MVSIPGFPLPRNSSLLTTIMGTRFSTPRRGAPLIAVSKANVFYTDGLEMMLQSDGIILDLPHQRKNLLQMSPLVCIFDNA